MANTWQPGNTSWLPNSFSATVSNDIRYSVKRDAGGFSYSLEIPSRKPVSLTFDMLLGGRRHGLGFLVPVEQIEGIPLVRRTLVQARYAWSFEKSGLLLAPGCSPSRPANLEAALGLTLSPKFQERCLNCHGSQTNGVNCESCHGPGSEHLTAVSRGKPREGIVNPKRLANQESIAVCANCHVGLTKFSDPSPDDLLVANQVRAIQSSECFLQSGKAFSCTACHDPHSDSNDDNRAVKACLGCHENKVLKHASICPVNAKSGCVACHMPSVEMGPLHLVDHLIRVHREQGPQTWMRDEGLRTEVQPLSEFLRIIAADSREAVGQCRERLLNGASFYDVAREVSLDGTSSIGGFLGRVTLAELDINLAKAAAGLAHGQISQPVQSRGLWLLLQRLPRDFRWDAEQLQSQAEGLGARGSPAAAIEKAQQALMIYPRFLRAINFIGTTFALSGNPRKAIDVFSASSSLYPSDATTQFLLASALQQMGENAKATEVFRGAISLEPDFTAAYLSLGRLESEANHWRQSIEVLRAGLEIDPLNAELCFELGIALRRSGDLAGAARATALAQKLDPALREAPVLH